VGKNALPDSPGEMGNPESDAVPNWVKGFHGAVGGPNFFSGTTGSVRELALSRRSAGFGRIDALTHLPGARLVVPTSETAVYAGQTLLSDAPDAGHRNGGALPDEPLTTFIDRRLAEAPYVYLPNRGRGYAVAKRALDVVGALVLLVLTAPVLLVLAVLIRIDSPGPALFRQTRVTRGGETFTFFKFRTMYVDARERFPELYRYHLTEHERDGTYYKLVDDPRNTRVGRWLRRTTLDELPNLINVLRGELSLVGPRPDLPELVRCYRPEELTCLLAKPGLTGLAQVAGRSLLTVRQRLTLDMRYVAQQTLLLDLRILWRTVIVVLTGRGAF
jgi:lipopolysaccharide/colanic/teichoic acid biosynthesis glycosyltransferase